MPDYPTDFSKLRILISNDDGIHAEGIRLLERFVRLFTQNVWVCAPATNQSAKSHSISMGKNVRVPVDPIDENHLAVYGTPVDSVLIGIQSYMTDIPPHYVFSGVNNGVNAAEDGHYSGTMAVAREAGSRGIRSIAFSQKMLRDGPCSWQAAEHSLPSLLPYLLSLEIPASRFLSVNFPTRLRADHEFAIVRQGQYELSQAVSPVENADGRQSYQMGAIRRIMPMRMIRI